MMLPHLVLGNFRYLDVWGNVQPARRTFTERDLERHRRINPDFDPQSEAAPAAPTKLTDENREYWEANAAKQGRTLDELMQL